MDHPYLQSSKSFGELLRLLREQAQLTQRELAARVGYSDAQINRYEKGARAPNPSVVAARFVKALELEPDSDLAATLIALAHKPTQIALDGPTSEASARLSMSFGNHTHSRTATLPQAAYSLVGRSAEWSTLLAVWQRTQLRPQLVLINGEAGIGKSRLAEEMLHWATAQGFHAAQTRAYSAEGRLAYGPIAELLRSPSIRPSLARLDDVWAVEVARIVPELQVERPKLVRHSKFDGAIERLRFFEALARAMFFDANPTLLVIDDLQWCDQETLEWLRFALRFESPGRLMIIGTVRSYELVPSDIISRTLDSLRASDDVTDIELSRLNADESARLAAQVLARPVESSEVEGLFADTDGNPLFVVEMARAGFANGVADTRQSHLHLPPRVRAVISSRLIRMSPPTQELINLAAVMGREFSVDLLAEVLGWAVDAVYAALDEMERRGFARSRKDGAFDFSHDKLREVVYASLTTAQRRQLHRRLAHFLENRSVNTLDTISGNLAGHYEHAGLYLPAAQNYYQAMQHARDLFANTEAVTLANRGLDLLSHLPAGKERDDLDLKLSTAKTIAINGSQFLNSLAHLQATQRALAVGQRLGLKPDPWIKRLEGLEYQLLEKFDKTLQIGKELLISGQTIDDIDMRIPAHHLIGGTYFLLGELEDAQTSLEAGQIDYEPSEAKKHILRLSTDPKTVYLTRIALVQWLRGFPDKSIQTLTALIEWTRQLGHPHSLTTSLGWDGFRLFLEHDVPAVMARCNEVITLSDQHAGGWWRMYARPLLGWAIGMSGDITTGITKMERGFEELRDVGTHNQVPMLTVAYAQLLLRAGKVDDALRCLQREVDLITADQSGMACERWFEAELHRALGEIALAYSADPSTAEREFCMAIRIARTKTSRMFELRAATSLARLWLSQGRTEEARNLLQPLCGWFAEGCNSNDLRAAKDILSGMA